MSYSFSILEATKFGAIDAAKMKFREIVEQQPAHEIDAGRALDAVNALVALLPDDDTTDVSLSVSGSVGGNWVGNHVKPLRSVNLTISAALVNHA